MDKPELDLSNEDLTNEDLTNEDSQNENENGNKKIWLKFLGGCFLGALPTLIVLLMAWYQGVNWVQVNAPFYLPSVGFLFVSSLILLSWSGYRLVSLGILSGIICGSVIIVTTCTSSIM